MIFGRDRPRFFVLFFSGNEDDLEGESNSIQNQRKLLQRYADEHGYINIRYFVGQVDIPVLTESIILERVPKGKKTA